LKQTDFDGKVSYSDISKVTLPTIPFFANLYPNPAEGEFTLELPFETGEASMVIMSSAGQVVHSGEVKEPLTKWNVSTLPAGIYFVKVLSNAGATAVKLVIR
jgi:hypothetical protein